MKTPWTDIKHIEAIFKDVSSQRTGQKNAIQFLSTNHGKGKTRTSGKLKGKRRREGLKR